MPYIKKAFRTMTESIVEVMAALQGAYFGQGKMEESFACLDWLLMVLKSLEPEEGFCETTPMYINILQAQGERFYYHGQRERAKECMLQARRLAKAYDAAPLEEIVTSRFFEGRLEGKSFLDQSHDTMLAYLEQRLHWSDPEEYPDYYALWDEVTKASE